MRKTNHFQLIVLLFILFILVGCSQSEKVVTHSPNPKVEQVKESVKPGGQEEKVTQPETSSSQTEASEDEKIMDCIIKTENVPTCFQLSTKKYSTWRECKQFQTAFDKLKCLFNAEDAFEDDSEELNEFALDAKDEFEEKYNSKYLDARRTCDYKLFEEGLEDVYESCCEKFSHHDDIDKLRNCLSEKIYESGLY
ncbi:MAG: hypothetical protein U9O94_11500 [Nanoarchaeota archaeon]|nr:hypothetical protein [Nanoarchaeota archaeon]